MNWRFITVLYVLAVPACAPLAKAPAKTSRLPPQRLAPDAVVLDVAFVRLPAADGEGYRQIWDAADEYSLGAERRRDLAANGLRVGVYGQELPAKLRELIDAPRDPLKDVGDGNTADPELQGTQQHVPVRSGHRAKIKASPVHPALALLITENGTLHGHQLTDAQCLLAVRPYPQSDGRVKLSVTPEIDHGAVKTRWTGGEGIMIQQTGQDRLVLDRLAFDALLSPGQSVVVSGTETIKGLGEHFFAETASGAAQRRILVIRLAQTQYDDLFAPEQSAAPLKTP
jgi:hypothetical protein